MFTRHPDFALDSAALIYPPILSERISGYYRIQASLDAEVNIPLLQKALDAIRSRFPYFQKELRKGAFWYFFEDNRAPNTITMDSQFPMQKVPTKTPGGYLFRVRASASVVSIEICHILTDGYGALIFFRSLLAEYYRLQGITTVYDETVFAPDGVPCADEWDDAFSRFAKPGTPKPLRGHSAWHLPGSLLSVHTMRVTTGTLSLADTLAKAKYYGATLTVYLAAVFLAALQDVQDTAARTLPRRHRKTVRLQVPANLRAFFPSRTLRNFSLYALPELDTRLGHYEFIEIITRIKATMAMAFTPKELQKTITRNVMAARNPFLRSLPLPVKNIIMRTLYIGLGENQYSSLSTNLGPVRLPASFREKILRVDLILPSTPGLRTVAGIVSHGDVLSISMGSILGRRDLEREFFTRLVRDGLKVKLESNTTM
jgi:hypothetical protein